MPGSLPLNIPESFSTFLRERSLTRARMRDRLDEAGRVRGSMAPLVRLAMIGCGAIGEEQAQCLASLDDAEGAGILEGNRVFLRAIRENSPPPAGVRDGLRATLVLLRALDPIAANTSPTVRL